MGPKKPMDPLIVSHCFQRFRHNPVAKKRKDKVTTEGTATLTATTIKQITAIRPSPTQSVTALTLSSINSKNLKKIK